MSSFDLPTALCGNLPGGKRELLLHEYMLALLEVARVDNKTVRER